MRQKKNRGIYRIMQIAVNIGMISRKQKFPVVVTDDGALIKHWLWNADIYYPSATIKDLPMTLDQQSLSFTG